MKKFKLIIDTDPGVDDATALVFALNDPQFDIKLFTVAAGNIHIEKASRNLCHLLDIFDKDIPVVNGYAQALGGTDEFAYFLHGDEGLGNYIPPKTTKHKPEKKDCAEAMYEVLKQYPHEVTIMVLGPHTNLAHLLMRYPDAKKLIKNIVMMGASIDGIKTNKNHRSFNIRKDAVAFKKTIESQLPVIMCPSKIGRDQAYFTEKQVNKIKNTNEIGKFLAKTFECYWEPGYDEKQISNCDLSAIFVLSYPKLFKCQQVFIDVDTEVNIGQTTGHYDKRGCFSVIQLVKREKWLNLIFNRLKLLSDLKITNKTFKQNLKEKQD